MGVETMNQTVERTIMKKTTIEITEDQYFFLKEKALELQKQNKNASIISIIRDLINKDMKQSARSIKWGRRIRLIGDMFQAKS